jgi:hypothetical protein
VALDSANFPAQIRTSEVANEEARSVLLIFFRKAMIKGTCGGETKGKATGKVRDQTHLKWCCHGKDNETTNCNRTGNDS